MIQRKKVIKAFAAHGKNIRKNNHIKKRKTVDLQIIMSCARAERVPFSIIMKTIRDN